MCPFCLSNDLHKKTCPRNSVVKKLKTDKDIIADLHLQVKTWKDAWFEAKENIGKAFWEVPYISYTFQGDIDPNRIAEWEKGVPYVKGLIFLLEGFFRIVSLNFMKSTCVKDKNGDLRWQDSRDNFHRIGGPAIELTNGHKEWIEYGEVHRLDGPAIEFANGHKKWFYYNNYIDCSSQEEFEALIKCVLWTDNILCD